MRMRVYMEPVWRNGSRDLFFDPLVCDIEISVCEPAQETCMCISTLRSMLHTESTRVFPERISRNQLGPELVSEGCCLQFTGIQVGCCQQLIASVCLMPTHRCQVTNVKGNQP